MVVGWLLFPLVLLAVCLGCGLAVEWAADWSLPGALLPALGLALVIVVSTLTTSRPETAPLTTPIVVALALAGYAVGWRRLRRLRPDGWALGVGLGIYAICAAPVVLSGNATFLGYFVDSDPAFHFILIDWLLAHGHDLTGVPASSYSAVANALHQYIGTAYPTGADVAVGAIRPLVGQDIAWIYQPYLAVAVALGAVALHELLDGVVQSRPLRAACAFIAGQAGLAYAFYLQASVKEIAATMLLTVLVVLVVETLRRPLRLRALVPMAIVTVAGLDVYSLTIVPWFGLPVAVFVVIAAWRARHAIFRGSGWRRAAVPAAVVVAIGAAAPVISGASTFSTVANQVLSQQAALGNLAAPLSRWHLLGIYPNGDFRFPFMNYKNAYALMGIALAGAVVGAVWMLRNRSRTFGPLLLLVTNGLAAIVLLNRAGPYAASKVIAIFSVTGVLTAMLGAVALRDAGRRIEGWILAAAIAGGVLWTNVLAFHDSSVAPQARFREMASIGHRFSGQGPAFFNVSDTFPVYFLRKEAAAVPYTFAGPVPLRPGLPAHGDGQTAAAWDPNELDFSFLQGFRLLILGRSPTISRPPANYRLVYRGNYYDVWQRTAAPRVLRHIPLSEGAVTAPPPPSCRTLTSTGALAARDHARLAYVEPPAVTTLLPTNATHPPSWAPLGKNGPPGFLSLGQNSGLVTGTVRVPATGDYTVWLQGSLSRRVIVRIDDKPVGTIRHQIGTAGQSLIVGKLHLPAGKHIVDILMPPSYYAPGNVVSGELLGPLMLVRDNAPPAVQEVAPRDARSLCGKSLQWLEIVD